jgi:hypothetical protein
MLKEFARWARNDGWSVKETDGGFIFEKKLDCGPVSAAVWGNDDDNNICVEMRCAAKNLTITQRLDLDRLHQQLRQAMLISIDSTDRVTWSSNVTINRHCSGEE